jgi:hypothetical protein
MPIAKITGQGLVAIALSVFLLWGFVLGQRALERRAYAERAQVLREIRMQQRRPRPIPVSLPNSGNPTSRAIAG